MESIKAINVLAGLIVLSVMASLFILNMGNAITGGPTIRQTSDTLVQNIELKEVIKTSDAAIKGDVLSMNAPVMFQPTGDASENPPVLLSEVEINVREKLFDNLGLGSNISVTFPGGKSKFNGVEYDDETLLEFAPGEQVILFVKRTKFYDELDKLTVTGYWQGKYSLGKNGSAVSTDPGKNVKQAKSLSEIKDMIGKHKPQFSEKSH